MLSVKGGLALVAVIAWIVAMGRGMITGDFEPVTPFTVLAVVITAYLLTDLSCGPGARMERQIQVLEKGLPDLRRVELDNSPEMKAFRRLHERPSAPGAYGIFRQMTREVKRVHGAGGGLLGRTIALMESGGSSHHLHTGASSPRALDFGQRTTSLGLCSGCAELRALGPNTVCASCEAKGMPDDWPWMRVKLRAESVQLTPSSSRKGWCNLYIHKRARGARLVTMHRLVHEDSILRATWRDHDLVPSLIEELEELGCKAKGCIVCGHDGWPLGLDGQCPNCRRGRELIVNRHTEAALIGESPFQPFETEDSPDTGESY